MAKKNVQEVEVRVKDSASGQIKQIQSRFGAFGSFLKSKFVFTLGDVSRAVTSVFSAMKDSINLEQQENALRGQLGSIGKDFDGFISTLKETSKNTVATADLIESSSRALLLGIPAAEIDELLKIAGSRAAATGQSVSQAFSDITTGIGRASPLILDNLGFTVNLTEAYGNLATSLGKTTDQLTQQEKSQALLHEVLVQGEADAEALGSAFDGIAGELARAEASVTNFKDGFNTLLRVLGLGALTIFRSIQAEITRFIFVLAKAASALADMASHLPFIGQGFVNLAETLGAAEDSLRETTEGLDESVSSLGTAVSESTKRLFGMKTALEEAKEAAGESAEEISAYVLELRGLTIVDGEVITLEEASAKATADKAEVVRDATDAGDAYREVLEKLQPELRQTALEFENTAQKAAQLNAETGGTLRVGSLTARTARQQADVDAAIAAGRRPYSGGTRIRTADGSGSRLLQVG